MPVVLDARGALDGVLVEGHPDRVALDRGLLERHEGLGRAEQTGADGDPLRGAGRVVEIDLTDGAELLPVGADGDGLAVDEALNLVGGEHEKFSLAVWVATP
jgi:hypothetical protein